MGHEKSDYARISECAFIGRLAGNIAEEYSAARYYARSINKVSKYQLNYKVLSIIKTYYKI